jgi:hypothetical protein
MPEPGNEPITQMSTEIKLDDANKYMDEHGFLYRPLELVGNMVQKLYAREHLRHETANFDSFKPLLEKDPVSDKSGL